ncbi:MAG: AAA family ATPase [Acidiferrobacterales bacterium]|nr:AAA family ATPase [Acidiferrobacterales bacterium]
MNTNSLIEREDAIARFEKATHRLNDELGGIVLVSGEAGMGKTSLLEETRRHYIDQFKFYWSGCDPIFTPQPFGPIHEIAEELSPKVLKLLDENAPSSTIFSELYKALENTKEPLILVFEDVHWADYATLDCFKFLARRISFTNCLLVLSYRDDEITGAHPFRPVLDVLPAGNTTRIKINPLSPEGVMQLALGSNQDAGELHRITAGNPFFITELLASDNKDEQTVPASVRDAINARLIRLAGPERQFLETISLIPDTISIELIEKLHGAEGETYAMACVARKLLVIDSHADFKFRHELARLGTSAGIPVSRQTRLHKEILSALEKCKDKDRSALIIHHAANALDAQSVLKYAPEAAKGAAKLGAHREAASYLGVALRFVDDADTQLAAQLYEDWAYETGLTLHINDEEIEAIRHAITLWRALDRKDKVGENLRWLSRLHWYRGESAEADHFADEAIKVLESIPASSERAMAYSLRSQLDMLNYRMDQAIAWGHRALDLEKQYPNPEIKVHALNNIGSAMVFRGNEKGEELLYESMELALKYDFHEHVARVYTNFSDYCVCYRKLEMAEKLIADGIAFDTAYDLDSWTYYLVGVQARLRLEQGRLEEAETISLGVLELDQLTLLMRLPALIVLARAQIRLGNQDCKKYIEQSLENAFATDELQYIIPARLGAVEAAWIDGNENLAFEQLKLLTELDVGELDHWQSGELAAWIRHFNFDFNWSPKLELPEPFQLELKGDYLNASEKWISMGLPYNAAIALMQVKRQDASVAFPKAYKMLESLRAKATLSKLKAKAKHFGILSKLPRARRGPYAATRHHPMGLTGKEQEVLKFMVAGASNQEIAESLSRSQRTVENHVSSILAKLNVANRMEVMLRVQNEPWLSTQD